MLNLYRCKFSLQFIYNGKHAPVSRVLLYCTFHKVTHNVQYNGDLTANQNQELRSHSIQFFHGPRLAHFNHAEPCQAVNTCIYTVISQQVINKPGHTVVGPAWNGHLTQSKSLVPNCVVVTHV